MSDSSLQTGLDGPVPGIPGAVVREVEHLPEHLEAGTEIGPFTEAAPGAFLFEVPGIARYLVRGGTSIDVAVADGADRRAAELFLHTSARAAMIHQRGELPLNAATLVAPNWKCVAICGPSAHGKSTLAAELCRRGWLLVADDTTRVSWNGSMAVAWPGGDKLKLWGDACAQFGFDTANLAPVRQGLGKYFVPVKAAVSPAALAAIVGLQVSPVVNVSFVPPSEGAALLSDAACRSRYVDALGCRAAHTRILGQVLSTSRLMMLDGARSAEVVELADRLANAVR